MYIFHIMWCIFRSSDANIRHLKQIPPTLRAAQPPRQMFPASVTVFVDPLASIQLHRQLGDRELRIDTPCCPLEGIDAGHPSSSPVWPSFWNPAAVHPHTLRVRLRSSWTLFPLNLALSHHPNKTYCALKLVTGALLATNMSRRCHYLVRHEALRWT
jgi:hypothetical protein